ncbi:hypothetical protein ACN28I_27255 [Archangium gephyra]|uniref:hypothetical protein n=1 Tax=Archangium gephyra TaxID=48 RepID=UPI003B79F339
MRAILLFVLLGSTLAFAQPLPARDTADVGPRGSWSVGVFNPLRIAVHEGLELQTHPLLFFVAPNVDARFALVRSPLRLTAEAGLSMPTLAMRLVKGYLFPGWETSQNDIGWMLIPRAGLLLSGNVLTHDVWTLRADAAFRVALGPNSATPLNSFLTPLDLVLAAPLTGFRSRVGGAYDHAFNERLRLRGEAQPLCDRLAGPSHRLGTGHGAHRLHLTAGAHGPRGRGPRPLPAQPHHRGCPVGQRGPGSHARGRGRRWLQRARPRPEQRLPADAGLHLARLLSRHREAWSTQHSSASPLPTYSG